MKINFKYFLMLLIAAMSMISFSVTAQNPDAPYCGMCATNTTTGASNCCGSCSPLCCQTCSMPSACIGETIEFRHVNWAPNPPYSDHDCYNSSGCPPLPTYWAIYTSCSVWTVGAFYPGYPVTGTSILSLNTTGMAPGIYWILADCGGVPPNGGGCCGTAAFPFEVIDCDTIPPPQGCDRCICDNDMTLADFVVDANGDASANLIVGPGSLAPPITKFRITLVNYRSNVDHECLKCDVGSQEMFGDIVNAPVLYGSYPQFAPYNPNLSVWYSREVTWCFDSEILDFNPGLIPLSFKFPPVNNLECCRNDVDFCLRVEIWNDGCQACDQFICNRPPMLRGPKPGQPINPDKEKIKIDPQGSIKAVPNPTRSGFDLKVSNLEVPGEARIYDAQGVLVRQLKVTGTSTPVDTKGFTPGVYLIKYMNATKTYEDKIVISK